jgi:hypothetical protein
MKIDINESLATTLASKEGEARLRSICLRLRDKDKQTNKTWSYDQNKKVSWLSKLNYGAGRKAIPFEKIAELFNII